MWRLKFAPDQASTFAEQYDWLFWATTALTIFFTIVVGLLVIFFALRFREGKKVDRSNAHDHHLMLELTWSIIPLIMGLGIFGWASYLFVETRQPPRNALDIYVIGKQWMWHAQHSNGVRENNMLHLPSGTPVRLTMISQDVIHSFFIPAFRMKQDVIPGRYTQMWFTPTKPGVYNLFCTEYCGTQHSEMGGYVVVMEPSEYQEWLANGGDNVPVKPMTMVQKGEKIFKDKACFKCHGDQDIHEGPSLVGIYNQRRVMKDNSVRLADDEYLRQAMYDPYAHILKGYENTMPSYKPKSTDDLEGGLSEEDVLNVIEYIKSLRSSPTAPAPAIPPLATGVPPTEVPN